MPLLKQEIALSPPHLFDIGHDEQPWLVVHVRSRSEKVLARYLLRDGIPYYLPQIEQRRLRSGRTYKSYMPLFGGYVFARKAAGAREAVWSSRVAVRLIHVLDQKQLTTELSQIHELQQRGAAIIPYVGIMPGDPVRIEEGVFRGYTGVVMRARGQARLIVSVSLLKKAMAVEFDRGSVTRVP